MKRSDRELGMDRPISRRDFLNGVGAVAAGSLVGGGALGCAVDDPVSPSAATAPYPPLRSGLRGSHPGSFEVAHQLAREGRTEWDAIQEPDAEIYDLVVVGGGISGLSAAHFYRTQRPDARILILDNHDDFGGHAKRNEFQLDGRTMIGYGGSQALEEPGEYSDVAQGLLREIGVEMKRFESAYDQQFYRSNGLRGGVYFDRETYGVDRVVPFELMKFSDYLPLTPSSLSASDAVAQMPLSAPAKRELLRLIETREIHILDVPASQQRAYLWRLSYRDFLVKHMGIAEPEIFALFDGMTLDMGVSIDAASALSMMYYAGLPGANATALGAGGFYDEPYIHHFPDGNAGVARLLVRSMIPQVAPGMGMEDEATARFDYARLDEASSAVRLRLNSTAVRVEHDGSPTSAKRVGVTYVRDGRGYRVWTRSCVLAGYNAMIPYLCPQLPKAQREALALAVKSPIVYTSVLLRNWRAWKTLELGAVVAPGSYHGVAMLDFPVSLGGYQFSQSPDDPIIVHMERFARGPNAGGTKREQFRAGRYELLTTPYETIERSIRTQLTGMLAPGGFEPARDIAAITVNRWPHGYAYYYSPMFDPEYADGEAPHEIGRKRFGRIAIANSDAGASASVDAAIDQAHRAVGELLG